MNRVGGSIFHPRLFDKNCYVNENKIKTRLKPGREHVPVSNLYQVNLVPLQMSNEDSEVLEIMI